MIPVLVVLLLALAPPGSAQTAVESGLCLDCHDEYDLSLAESPHRLSSESYQPTVPIGCASCHEGTDAHVEDPSVDNITNPAQLTRHEAGRACRQCHQPHQELDNYGFDSHSNLEMNCASCHRIHNYGRSLLLDDRARFCLDCHSEMRAKFSRRSSHPVLQDNLTCLSCHLFTRRTDHNVVYGLDRICQDCHPEQGGPFLHEHGAAVAHEVGGSGCVECHDPHGSENDRLLKQPGNNLCRSCHVEHVTRNHNKLWDSVWSQRPCQTCHVDTHGSYVSALYLDPDLPAKLGGNCYDPGCHSLNGQGGN